MDSTKEAFDAYNQRVEALISALKLEIEHKDALILTLVKLVHRMDSSHPAYVLPAAEGGTAHVMIAGDGPIVHSATVIFKILNTDGKTTTFGITTAPNDNGLRLPNSETANDSMQSGILPDESPEQ